MKRTNLSAKTEKAHILWLSCNHHKCILDYVYQRLMEAVLYGDVGVKMAMTTTTIYNCIVTIFAQHVEREIERENERERIMVASRG